MIIIKKDSLTVKICSTRAEMGRLAASEAAEVLKRLLSEKEQVNIIFAAAPSQNETLATLTTSDGIDWTRVNAFHMDEYVGLAPVSKKSFAAYLNAHIFGLLPFRSVNYIRGYISDITSECQHYSELLRKYPPDIVLLGIGENGHIAFNDPHVADFSDSELVKEVTLDETCRAQQVHDGCFASLCDVPKSALTLTIPALTNATYMFCSVPAATKAGAVKNMLFNEVSEKCPATILRHHQNAFMYCDADSGRYII